MPDFVKPLFNRNLLKSRVNIFFPDITEEQRKVISDWARITADPSFKNENEKPHQGEFLTQLFGQCLGYEQYAASPSDYSLKAETARRQLHLCNDDNYTCAC